MCEYCIINDLLTDRNSGFKKKNGNIQIIESDVKVKEDVDKLIYRVRVQVNFEIER